MRKIKVNFGGTFGFREALLLLCPHTPSLLFLKKLLCIPFFYKGRGFGGTVGSPRRVHKGT